MLIYKHYSFEYLFTFISSPETVSTSPSDVITSTLRFQRNRLPAHIPRVGHSRVGEQEERTLGYAGTNVVDNASNSSGQKEI